MKDYASMSDQQINQEVQKLTGMGCMSGAGVLIVADGRWRMFDPCNNPADAWPIIVENKITIDAPLPQNQYWTAEKHDVDGGLLNFHVSTNPLRCAMIVFLMMKEIEND